MASRYWVGGTGTWNATTTHWSTTSGGAGGASVPTPTDDAFFDANSGGGTITFSSGTALNWDFTGFTGTFSFATLFPTVRGSLTLGAGMTFAAAGGFTLIGTANFTIKTNGTTLAGTLALSGVGGYYTLLDALTVTSGLQINDGTFNDGGFRVTASTVISNSGRTRAIVRSGAWLLTATAASSIWSVTAAGLTLTDTGSMSITNVTANTRTIAGFGLTYGTLNYTITGSTGGLVITGANTFAAINFSDSTNARTLTLPASTVTTIGGWGVVGTAGKLMSVVSSTSGTAATLKRLDGIAVASDYLSIKDITAQSSGGGSGTGLWYAGTHSTDVSGNTGWTFADPVGSAALSGSGSLSAAAAPGYTATTSLTGSGSLTATGTPSPTTAVALTGSGTLTAAASPATSGTAALTGSGTLTAAGTPATSGVVTLTGSGSLTLTVAPNLPGLAFLTGLGNLTASATLTALGVATFSGEGTLNLTSATPAPTPLGNIYTVPADVKTVIVVADARAFTVTHARAYIVPADMKDHTQPADDRSYVLA